MIASPDPEIFHARLVAWSIRGVLCAAPSFGWALFTEFQQPVQFGAMLAGIVTYVIAFAWATSLPAYCERVETSEFGWSFRVAANARAALAPLMFFGPDTFLGALSIWLIRQLAGPFADAKSFGFTYAITVTQGALVSMTMFGLALTIWLVRTQIWNRLHVGFSMVRRTVEALRG